MSPAQSPQFCPVVWLTLLFTGCDSSGATPRIGRTAQSGGGVNAVTAPGPSPKNSSNSTDSPRQGDWFEDVTERTGIRFTSRNGREAQRFYLIESFGGGVAMLDFDLDGDVDLFFTGGGRISASPSPPAITGLPSRLYRNDGEWMFSDVSQTSGFGEPPDYSFGCTTTDFDGDFFVLFPAASKEATTGLTAFQVTVADKTTYVAARVMKQDAKTER